MTVAHGCLLSICPSFSLVIIWSKVTCVRLGLLTTMKGSFSHVHVSVCLFVFVQNVYMRAYVYVCIHIMTVIHSMSLIKYVCPYYICSSKVCPYCCTHVCVFLDYNIHLFYVVVSMCSYNYIHCLLVILSHWLCTYSSLLFVLLRWTVAACLKCVSLPSVGDFCKGSVLCILFLLLLSRTLQAAASLLADKPTLPAPSSVCEWLNQLSLGQYLPIISCSLQALQEYDEDDWKSVSNEL